METNENVREWRKLIEFFEKNGSGNPVNRLVGVNSFFNIVIEYLSDNENWDKKDYWSTPRELLTKGKGDCEDFAIAKYFTLLEMGIPVMALRLTYVKNNRTKEAHMVLTCEIAGYNYILDNAVKGLDTFAERPELEPVYSFNDKSMWVGKNKDPISTNPGKHLNHWVALKERMKKENA